MLVPLRDEHRRFRSAELVSVESEHIERFVNEFRGGRTALLVVEDPDRPSLRERFASPVRCGADATEDLCIGWLHLQLAELGQYAMRAATLLNRNVADRPVVLLAPRERRYLDLIGELESVAHSLSLPTLRWSAERIRRSPLTRALRVGAGAVLYSGHGNAGGWLAYGGLTASMIAGDEPWTADETTAMMISLSCSTGRRRRPARASDATRRGFADDIVASGVAGAVLAPLTDPLHSHSRLLAEAVVRALAEGDGRVCDVLQSIERHGTSLDGYAVVGDPALPVRCSAGAAARGAAVFAPSPDVVLEVSGTWGER
jgi:hypothetical protein